MDACLLLLVMVIGELFLPRIDRWLVNLHCCACLFGSYNVELTAVEPCVA
jgi:hypothetical protein